MAFYILEIKNRVLLVTITLFSTVASSYVYKETLLFLIVKSSYRVYDKHVLISNYLIFTDVTEIFSVYVKLIFFLSFQVLLLFIFYHVFIFVSPALYKTEFQRINAIVKVIYIIWVVSSLLANYLIIPISWNFFLSFQNLIQEKFLDIYFEAKLNEYFYFYTSFYSACVFYFQGFALLFFIISENNANFKKFRKLYYFSFVLFSTFLCPDFLSQLIVSFVTIFIYEIAIFTIFFKKTRNTLC